MYVIVLNEQVPKFAQGRIKDEYQTDKNWFKELLILI